MVLKLKVGLAALLLAVIIYGGLEIYQSQVTATRRSAVRAAMSATGPEPEAEGQVIALGEQAVPIIFDEMRAHPTALYRYRGTFLVVSMVTSGTVDETAPCIRGVLDNDKETESVRIAAAALLGWYWKSREVEAALMRHASADRSTSVRTRCLWSVAQVTRSRACRNKNWKVEPGIKAFFSDALRDSNQQLRQEACLAIGGIAENAAVDAHVHLGWTHRLLVKARSDPQYEVRKAAVDVLAHLEQVRLRHGGTVTRLD